MNTIKYEIEKTTYENGYGKSRLAIKIARKLKTQERLKLLFLTLCLIMGLSFIMIGAKMTPQWLEVQSLTRTVYITGAIGFLAVGLGMLWLPIKYMLRGVHQ
jgi:hypothetical protein